VNGRDADGRTGLHVAAAAGNLSIVNLLLRDECYQTFLQSNFHFAAMTLTVLLALSHFVGTTTLSIMTFSINGILLRVMAPFRHLAVSPTTHKTNHFTHFHICVTALRLSSHLSLLSSPCQSF
jgi:hypothetical protein